MDNKDMAWRGFNAGSRNVWKPLPGPVATALVIDLVSAICYDATVVNEQLFNKLRRQ
jgi:hypothetical protein